MNPVLLIRRFTVVEIKWETLEVFTLVLAPENPAEMISFLPGQWVYLHFVKPDGTSEERRAYSIASAPEESKESMEFGVKVHGPFTKRLSKVMPGDVIGVQGPFGVFTLRADRSPQYYLAAGIGVTPFRSMIRSLRAQGSTTPIYLVYSSKTIESAAYYFELRNLAKEWPSFHPIFTLTQELPRIWDGEQGRIDRDMLARHLPAAQEGDYLACGSSEFMQLTRQLLEERGVEIKKQYRTESFG